MKAKEQKEKHRKYMREYMRARRAKEGPLPWDQNYYKKLKTKVFKVLRSACCTECGCDEESILEINHVKGGGRKERPGSQIQIYRRIARREIKPGEFNILCRVCNAAHYVRDLLGIKGHKVTWVG